MNEVIEPTVNDTKRVIRLFFELDPFKPSRFENILDLLKVEREDNELGDAALA